MASTIHGWLKGLCGQSSYSVEIPMDEMERGAASVQEVAPGCLDRMKDVWNGWGCATKVCMASTGAIIVLGSVMSIGVVCGVALGGAALLPALTTASTVAKGGIEVKIDSPARVMECIVEAEEHEVKLGAFEAKDVKNFYSSVIPKECLDKNKDELVQLNQAGYKVAYTIRNKKGEIMDDGYYSSKDLKKYYVIEGDCKSRVKNKRQNLESEQTVTEYDVLEAVVKKCKME